MSRGKKRAQPQRELGGMHARRKFDVMSQKTLQMVATACSTEKIMSFFIEFAII